MQRLLKLLNLPLKQTEQNRNLPLHLVAEWHSQRRQLDLSSTDKLEPKRRNHSLQNHTPVQKNNSALRVKGISHSQRLGHDLLPKNQNIRITKNTYRISRHPTTSSEITISNKLTVNHTEIAQIIQNSSKKITTININPSLQNKMNILNRSNKYFREKYQGRQSKEARQTQRKEKRKLRTRKCKMLTMIGKECKIFNLIPLKNKKNSEDDNSGTIDA